MEYKIVVVGIGPGSPDYLLPIALKTIKNANVLVGSKRALETYAGSGVITKVIDKDITAAIDFIKNQLRRNDVVVMVSGDPGFYSILKALKDHFSNTKLKVIPGISSVQLAFARLNELWHDAVLTSLHGREQDTNTLKYEPHKRMGILTDNVNKPQKIAARLLSLEWPEQTRVWLCENLSYENESIVLTTLKDVLNIDGFAHCVMVVKA